MPQRRRQLETDDRPALHVVLPTAVESFVRSVRIEGVECALPLLIRSGIGFWASMAIVVAGTLALYALMFWAAPRLGLKL